jgi:hypothetical protein
VTVASSGEASNTSNEPIASSDEAFPSSSSDTIASSDEESTTNGFSRRLKVHSKCIDSSYLIH